ncbi:hypothetical protein MCOR27_009252 [Pyricularia oryzae]|uniref:tRNA(Phe) 7-[(3-amino-3-carboxypropyl)-4-demethylwyosine(37)-N(4)]-methyltransferase n=2 Tax=Pyricularia TaxID=48558 RepID=A0ABQ8N8G6_PYRGI|nr:hypothetical protein MCOR01_005113 [Pyricularia oryzae]KAI6292173.1 hypothetical protein MCOR33_010036 [Pyricularia grisea]KAH9431875.1 hypothetical protein MCOR02_009144 [Pyricularia oryzae]KAI6256505.1 hypothetical protein MCOR19_007012 [Pyricularia oryzae]KAI6270571.1 hypothetical protein MCOR27_009252 [Pyricularia oryzae]
MTITLNIPIPFLEKKAKIIAQLATPDSTYTDASPKGSVDVGIRELIAEINCQAGLVTTSSCAGRVSVFLEGKKAQNRVQVGGGDAQLAGTVGGKGGGGRWLYVSHEPFGDVGGRSWEEVLFGADGPGDDVADEGTGEAEERLVHFKFEPMILHILTASSEHAQSVIRCGLEAGFRESGAINLLGPQQQQQATPMVAIRSMGLGLESIVGTLAAGGLQCLVTPQYLAMLVRISNERFRQNAERIERFRLALQEEFGEKKQTGNPGWEDAAARRERKKAEGLRRREEIAKEKEKSNSANGNPDMSDEQPISIP